MRFGRISFILLALYFVFLGGSAYYGLLLPVRIFHHLLTTAALALWLIARLRSGRGLPDTSLNLPLCAAALVWFITALASLDPRMAFEHLWFQFVHIALFFVLVDLIQRGRQRLLMETQFMLAAGVIFLSGLETASWYFGLGILPGTHIGWVSVLSADTPLPLQPIRLALAMNISTLLAGYVAPLVTLCLAWALTARRSYRPTLRIITFLLLIILVFTFSRGGLLSLLAAAGTFAALRLSQMSDITRRIPARTLLAVAGVTGIVIVSLFLILTITQSSSRTRGDLGRLDMWVSAARMTGDDPLTGVGPGLFGRAFRDYRDPTVAQDKLASAHNAYLNTAAETGLGGILVSLWLGGALLLSWKSNWQRAENPAHRLRLEAAFAALVGLGVHSLVDVFTVTPVVTLLLLLVAYCITPLPQTRFATPPQSKPWPALCLLLILLAYGGWFIILDKAQSDYESGFHDPALARISATNAAQLDPTLNLYPLHLTHLSGQEALNAAVPDLAAVIADYEHALRLEPTWDVGWINLAALRLQDGDFQDALAHLETAHRINNANPAGLYWAVLAEQHNAAPEAALTSAYFQALRFTPHLPLSAFWSATEPRRRALDQFLQDDLPLDHQYRILAVHAPERAYALVPEAPATAPEWWTAGEYALSIEHNPAAAVEYFTNAIIRDRSNGDYYASRARAHLPLDPHAARLDLDIATLLTTDAEYPNAIRAELTDDPDEKLRLWATALPPRQVVQEFAAVLYGRPAQFDLFPHMRHIGPGRAAMQPWYALAAYREAEGDLSRAANVYRVILDYAPDETEAQHALDRLSQQ